MPLIETISHPQIKQAYELLLIEMALIVLFLHPPAPGPVLDLSYEEDTDTSVNITWESPKKPNGDIVAYVLEHGVYQDEPTTSVRILARGGPMYTVIRALGKYC